MPGARPARIQQAGQHLHDRLPGQRGGRLAGEVPERGHRAYEARDAGLAARRPTGVDGLRRGEADAPRAGGVGRRSVRLRRGVWRGLRDGQGGAHGIRPDTNDARHAVHRRRRGGRRPAPLARGEQLRGRDRRQGLLRDERLVVRRVHVRDSRPEEPVAGGPAARAGRRTHSPAAVGPHGGARR